MKETKETTKDILLGILKQNGYDYSVLDEDVYGINHFFRVKRMFEKKLLNRVLEKHSGEII